MVTVDPKKTVRIHIEPIEQNQPAVKLENYLRSELKKRSKIEDVDLS